MFWLYCILVLLMKINPMNKSIDFTSDPIFIQKIYDSVPQSLKLTWLELLFSYLEKYASNLPIHFKQIKEALNTPINRTINELDVTSSWLDFIQMIKGNPTDSSIGLILVKKLNELFDYLDGAEMVVIHYVESALTLFYYEANIKEIISNSEDMRKFIILDDILWNDWDPIRVNGTSARHEYYRYNLQLIELLKQNPDDEKILEFFQDLHQNQLGIVYDDRLLHQLIQKIKAIN